MKTRETADINFCVPCNDTREFVADANHQLTCRTCGWELSESKAVAAAQRWEQAQRKQYAVAKGEL